MLAPLCFWGENFMIKKEKFALSTTQIIALSFLVTILVGSILLALPISSANGEAVPYIDALFMATTSTCVTGLVTLPTVSTWSLFGQIVILLLIQIGGLGVITIMSGIMLLFHRKMGLGHRLLIQDAFNLNTMSGLVKFVKKVLFGTLIIEGIGALLYMIVFIPKFGARGIWISIFNSVSAFCNAGIDIIAENSLCDFATNPLVNIVTSILIVLGGIGYIVWWDVIRVVNSRSSRNKKIFRHLTLHSKIAITFTLGLIFVGAFLILIFEYNNPTTIGNLSFFDKIQVALFQSVTTRTAGFATIPQENLTDASTIVSLVLMFIGGSPVGTAGGVKTVTIAVLVCSAFATIRNKNDVTMFGRRISEDLVRKSVAVMVAFVMIGVTSSVLLMATNDVSAIDALYEAISATATVGLSRNITAMLNLWGKLVIIVTMYLGRIGPITLAVMFASKQQGQNLISEPVEDVSIG